MPRTRRRPAMIGLAVLLIVGCAAIAGLLALRLDSRAPALVAARPISIGEQITAADLTTERIAGENLDVLGADQASAVVGKYAAEAIPQGRLLDSDMIAAQSYLKPGVVAVGILVQAGRVPASGLRIGDHVQVIQVADGQSTVIVDDAVVSNAPSTDSSSGGGFLGAGSSTSGSGTTVATLIVAPSAAPKVAAASAANQVAVVLKTRGQNLNTGS